jgi:hypothetical protein
LKENGVNDVDQPLKIYSRLDNNKQITNKKGLFVNMREYYKVIGVEPFSVLPITFLVKSVGDDEFRKFENYFVKSENLICE